MIEDNLKKAEKYLKKAEELVDKKVSIYEGQEKRLQQEQNNLLKANCYSNLANYYQNRTIMEKE